MKQSNHNKEKSKIVELFNNIKNANAFLLPKGWVYILAGFVFSAFFIYLNYDYAKDGYKLAKESHELAKQAQEEPKLKTTYKKIKWAGAVLQPNLSKLDVCKDSHDSTKYNYEINKMNRIRIVNSSPILAKRVRVKLKIDDEAYFVFSVITVNKKYEFGSDWRDVKIDRDRFKFIDLEIDTIKGNSNDCDIYFVYAYPRSLKPKKEIKKDALTINVSHEGQRKPIKELKVDLGY